MAPTHFDPIRNSKRREKFCRPPAMLGGNAYALPVAVFVSLSCPRAQLWRYLQGDLRAASFIRTEPAPKGGVPVAEESKSRTEKGLITSPNGMRAIHEGVPESRLPQNGANEPSLQLAPELLRSIARNSDRPLLASLSAMQTSPRPSYAFKGQAFFDHLTNNFT